MPIRNRGMGDYVDPIQNTVSLLESGQDLPDDDPRTRNGGLNPARGKDIAQINMYMSLRQNGQMSDQAWAKLIQRNPRSAVLFSQVGPSPEVLATRNTKDILGKYFDPGTPDRPYTDADIGSGIGPYAVGQTVPGTEPTMDYRRAVAEAVQRGNPVALKMVLDAHKAVGGGEEDKNWAIRLAMRAAGIDPGKTPSQLSPSEAQSTYKYYSPPFTAPVPNGTLVVPRGGISSGVIPNIQMTEKQQAQVTGVENLKDAISTYRQQLSGFGGSDYLNPGKRKIISTAYNNMMLQAKEAYNLGVLNGPDYQILTDTVTDPTSISGTVVPKKYLDQQAQLLDQMMTNIGAVAKQGKGFATGPINKTTANSPGGSVAPNITPDQARQELIRRGVIRQ